MISLIYRINNSTYTQINKQRGQKREGGINQERDSTTENKLMAPREEDGGEWVKLVMGLRRALAVLRVMHRVMHGSVMSHKHVILIGHNYGIWYWVSPKGFVETFYSIKIQWGLVVPA